MDIYEKPRMEVIEMSGTVVTDSCPDDTYECDTELPPICIWGD